MRRRKTGSVLDQGGGNTDALEAALEAALRRRLARNCPLAPGEVKGAIAFTRFLLYISGTSPDNELPSLKARPAAWRQRERRRRRRELKRTFPTSWKERWLQEKRDERETRRRLTHKAVGRPRAQVWATVWLLRAVCFWNDWRLIALLLNAAMGSQHWTPTRLRTAWNHRRHEFPEGYEVAAARIQGYCDVALDWQSNAEKAGATVHDLEGFRLFLARVARSVQGCGGPSADLSRAARPSS